MDTRKRTSSVNEAMFKLIIIGDSGVGKSCLMNRYTKDEYSDLYKVTIGVQFASKTVVIDENYHVKLQIWDTAGQQSFQSIVKSFYRNSGAVILVYNITNKRSFQSLENWISESRENSPLSAIFILMGTHLDMEDKREVSREEAIEFMQKEQISLFFQTSSKTALNVNKAFDQVAKQLFMDQIKRKREVTQICPNNPSVELSQQTTLPVNKGCC